MTKLKCTELALVLLSVCSHCWCASCSPVVTVTQVLARVHRPFRPPALLGSGAAPWFLLCYRGAACRMQRDGALKEPGAQGDISGLGLLLEVALMDLGLFAIKYSHVAVPTTFFLFLINFLELCAC